MAEFQEIMREFDRMCWYYQRKRKCPMGCPMNGVNISQCRKIAFEDPERTEKTVMDWSKNHPVPVYPTWLEWLEDQGILTYKCIPIASSTTSTATSYRNVTGLSAKAFMQIPEHLAKKLDIQPKEG